VPQVFNAASYLLDRRLEAGDGDRIAVTGPRGTLTYHDLYELTCRIAAGLTEMGVRPEQRVVLFTVDSSNMAATILAAMRIGAVPVPVSTMLKPHDLAGLLRDSRATVLVISPEFADTALPSLTDVPDLRHTILEGGPQWQQLLTAGKAEVYPTWDDTTALWLYTSGTTGAPKGAMHRHAAIRVVCENYGRQVLGIRADDRVLSAAKMFFAYGLGASLLFPLSVGASVVLEPAPATALGMTARLREHRPTIFVAGPTFFAGMLNASVPADAFSGVRLATSAGEPLPQPIYQRFLDRYGVQIIDGLGSTEALHIFISNRPGSVTPGSSGFPVPGYRVRVVDDKGADVPSGVEGHLLVSGDSVAQGYWCRYDTSRRVFQGEWLRTGDFYVASPDGTYTYLGRSDDMIKSSGMWVSPAEVEARLLQHPDVAMAAVVAVADDAGLDKTVACVVRQPGTTITADELIIFCREGIAHFKCPRAILFVDELPLTATGKVRRNVVRGQAAEILTAARAGER
jgi:benzoate-CoA ligase family protein